MNARDTTPALAGEAPAPAGDAQPAADEPEHVVTKHWDAVGGEVLEYTCSCGESWTRDEERCPEDDDDGPGDLAELIAEWDRQAAGLQQRTDHDSFVAFEVLSSGVAQLRALLASQPDWPGMASEMVCKLSMAPSARLLPWRELPQDLAFLASVIDHLGAGGSAPHQGATTDVTDHPSILNTEER